MLRKFNTNRSLSQNIKLGSLTAFSAGMVNVAGVMAFFAFTSNITGHVAILAEEISRGHWHQVSVVFIWLSLFFAGNFFSNFLIIHTKNTNSYLSHSIPLILEIVCLAIVGYYGYEHYKETLKETEYLVALLIFAMGLQNGLTASISNSTVKTTHLTGLFTDLAIAMSMLTQKQFRNQRVLKEKIMLLSAIGSTYLVGGIASGYLFQLIGFRVFFVVCLILFFVLAYDFSAITHSLLKRKFNNSNND
jgi:uncharacterized membrane protein YoaK (UPF0700 family)